MKTRTFVTNCCYSTNVGTAVIDGVFSTCFTDRHLLSKVLALTVSIAYDFFIKTTGKSDLRGDLFGQLPLTRVHSLDKVMISSILPLVCITNHYADLWQSVQKSPWTPSCALRTDWERRRALVELDALAALALGLTEEELVTIYRVQFPVLQQYEREDRYDRLGRLVPGEVMKMAERHNIDIHAPLNVHTFRGAASLVGEAATPELGMTGGIRWLDPKMEPRMDRIYPPPYTKNDRETEMRAAYRKFQESVRAKEVTA